MRDRNDFKAADVKWTGVMGDIYFTLLLLKVEVMEPCFFRNDEIGEHFLLVFISISDGLGKEIFILLNHCHDVINFCSFSSGHECE